MVFFATDANPKTPKVAFRPVSPTVNLFFPFFYVALTEYFPVSANPMTN